MNRKFLLTAPALAIVILAANWNAQSRDDQPVSKLDQANRKECPTDSRGGSRHDVRDMTKPWRRQALREFPEVVQS
ncbi:MAG TPA: hypothetical protein VN857_12985 [Chthoniobacterales bacterium]|nr:hypothetical protein [Chthoniobacterales bacterium]